MTSRVITERDPRQAACASSTATVEWTRASRHPQLLWRLAGFGDSSQALRFVAYTVRPPLVSKSTVPVVAQLTEPLSTGRRVLAVAGLLAAGAATGAVLPSRPVWAIVMGAVLLVLAARVATRALHGGVAAGNVRLHDIVARRRHTGDGERSLRCLLGGIDRDVELDVAADRPGLVAMYSRLGFVVSEPGSARTGLIRMTRPAPSTTDDRDAGRS